MFWGLQDFVYLCIPLKYIQLKTFSELGISGTFIKALDEINIITPTEIQEKAIPFLIEKGTDFIGQAQTGTGKTAAYGLPILACNKSRQTKYSGIDIVAYTRAWTTDCKTDVQVHKIYPAEDLY